MFLRLKNLIRFPFKSVAPAFALVFFLHILVAVCGVCSEWIYHHHGWAGARRSINARNYLRFGYIDTRFAPLDNVGATRDGSGRPVRQYKYWHHPPGFAVLLSFAFLVFGDSELVARSVSILLTTGALIFLSFALYPYYGITRTILGCLILLFIPIYSTYINFVNFEPLVYFSMCAIIFFYNSCRQNPKIWKLALLSVAVFTGAFSDYPIYPFFFLFFLLITSLAIINPKSGAIPVIIFVLMLIISAVAVLLQFISMQDSVTAFKGLFMKRYNLGEGVSIKDVLEKWNYYRYFFTPVVIIFSLIWIIDSISKLFLKKITIAHGYITVLLLTALCYFLLIPQGAKIHEYAVFYFSLPLSFASAGGIELIATGLSRGSLRLKKLLLMIFTSVLIISSIPHIYEKKICPLYEFVTPVHKLKSDKLFDYQLSYNILARFLKNLLDKSESVGILSSGFDIRPEFQYYLDRTHKMIGKPEEALNEFEKKRHSFILINSNSTDDKILTRMLESSKFVFINGYYAFDTGHHLQSIVCLDKKPSHKNPFFVYLNGLAYYPYTTIEDLWCMVDMELKLGGIENAEKMLSTLKHPEDTSFYKKIALLNLSSARGKRIDISSLLPVLDFTDEAASNQNVEFMGVSSEKKLGKTTIRFLFYAHKKVDFSVSISLEAEPLHKNTELRNEIGNQKISIKPVIPSSLWRPGYIYIAEKELQLFPGPYSISFKILPENIFQSINSRNLWLGKGDYGVHFPAEWLYRYFSIH